MKPLNKKIWRDMKLHPGQFFSVALIVVCATALFIGMYSLLLNLQYSKQLFYREYRFADVFARLERAPETALRRAADIDGVLDVRGRIVEDVPLEVEGNPNAVVGRIISMPEQGGDIINNIHIVRGSYFPLTHEREAVVNQRFIEENNLEVGDTFEATLDGARETLTIVGTAYSPEYVYLLRSAEQFLPDDRNFGLVFVQQRFAERAFDMTGAFNDLSAVLSPDADPEEVADRIEKRLDRYGVHVCYTREDQVSHYILREELKSIRGMALTIPLAFLIIAALILHILLARITEQQRAQIGTLIATGYSKKAVAAHYLSYGVILSVTGTLIGTFLGFFITGWMLRQFAEFYRFPDLVNRFYPHLSLLSVLLVAGACLAGVSYTVIKVVNIQPALAMKPKPPPSAHRIFIERIGWLWSRLGLVSRTTIRTCLRAKTRSILSLLGVVVSVMLLMVGMWAGTWMDMMIHFQFGEVDNSDLSVEFRRENALRAVTELSKLPGVVRAEGILNVGFELRTDWKTENLSIMGLAPGSRLHNIFDDKGRKIPVPREGVILPDFLMDKFGVTVGDTVELEAFVKDKPVNTVRVVGRSKEYFGLTGYADRRYLAGLLREGDMVNGARLTVADQYKQGIIETLKDRPEVISAVSSERLVQSFDEMLSEWVVMMSGLLILMAAIISFSVIYSTSAINISEREREIASLLAIGWTPEEASDMVTADIIPMGILGLAVGMPLSRLIPRWISYAFDSEVFRVPTEIGTYSYVQVGALLFIFVLIARLICLRKAAGTNILKALGTRE